MSDDYEAVEATCLRLAGPSRHHDARAACSIAEEAMQRNPEDVRFAVLLALVKDLIGEWEEAEQIYRDVLARAPREYEALRGLALLYGYPGVAVGPMEAVELLQQAVSVAPERWEAFMTLAQVLRRLGRYAEAVGAYQDALDRVPHSHPIAAEVRREMGEAESDLRGTSQTTG